MSTPEAMLRRIPENYGLVVSYYFLKVSCSWFLFFGFYLPVVCHANRIQEENIRFFDIPALPLQQSIIEFALQAKCDVLAQEDNLAGLRGRRLFGYHTPKRALERLLDGSHLAVEFQEPAKIFIIRPQSAYIAPTESQPVEIERAKIDEVIVTGTRYPLRYHTIQHSEDRYGNALFDSSRAHNVLPQAIIADSASDDLLGAMRYISSATGADGLLGSNDDYFIRGFPRQNTYINGLRLSNNTALQVMPDTIERLDILKGPSMLFYGQSSAGGLVDILKKRPTSDDSLLGEVLISSGGSHKVLVEANKADLYSEDLNLLLIGLEHQEHSGEHHNQKVRRLYSARAQAQWQEKLAFEMGYEHQNLQMTTALTLPVFSDSGQFLPFYGYDLIHQANDEYTADIDLFDASASYSLNSDWRIQGNFLAHRELRDGVRNGSDFLTNTNTLLTRETDIQRIGLATILGQMAAPILRLNNAFTFGLVESIYDQYESETAYSGSLVLNGSTHTGPVGHRVIAGIDVYSQDMHQQFAVEERVFIQPPIYSAIMLKQSQLALIDALRYNPPQTLDTKLKYWNITREDLGVYLQIQSNWTHNWSTSIGWRHSEFRDGRVDLAGSNPELTGNYQDSILQVGSSWQLNGYVSLYGNYAETLSLNYLLDDFWFFVEQPEKSSQQELGLKWLSRDNDKLATFALYNIESAGIHTIEFVAGYRRLQPPQERKAVGIELDATWRVNDHIEWIISAALADNDLYSHHPEVRYSRMVADQTAAIFGRFSLPESWALYIGANYVSDRSLDGTGELTLGEYSILDLAIEKTFPWMSGNLKLRSLIKNIFDEYHPSAATPGMRATPSQGRRLDMQMTYSF